MVTGKIRICQSCGMPMSRTDDFGTEVDGGLSADYCTHCYRNGVFTYPDATVDDMAAISGPIMAQIYSIPLEKAKAFSREQLSCLKRWTKREIPSCGSCGMPLLRDEDAGTEADGRRSENFCTYCYRDGAYTEPDLTREQAVERYAPMMASNLGMPIEKAEEMVRQYISMLPRWQVR